MEQDGVILIDKPSGMTSFGVVARIRRVLEEQQKGKGETREADLLRSRRDEGRPLVVLHKRKRAKVGHCGTLDPFATGLMIIVTGKECRNAGVYTKHDKVYEATFVLGQVSTTGDPEGTITAYSSAGSAQSPQERLYTETRDLRLQIVPEVTVPHQPTIVQVKEVLEQFVGEIMQRPPIFSAIKINGQRAYKLARDGKEVEIPDRTVTIHSLELVSYEYPELKVRTHVSSGTYIRSLAVDIGEALGTGAYCSELRRTRIAEFDVAQAKTLADFGVTD